MEIGTTSPQDPVPSTSLEQQAQGQQDFQGQALPEVRGLAKRLAGAVGLSLSPEQEQPRVTMESARGPGEVVNLAVEIQAWSRQHRERTPIVDRTTGAILQSRFSTESQDTDDSSIAENPQSLSSQSSSTATDASVIETGSLGVPLGEDDRDHPMEEEALEEELANILEGRNLDMPSSDAFPREGEVAPPADEFVAEDLSYDVQFRLGETPPKEIEKEEEVEEEEKEEEEEEKEEDRTDVVEDVSPVRPDYGGGGDGDNPPPSSAWGEADPMQFTESPSYPDQPVDSPMHDAGSTEHQGEEIMDVDPMDHSVEGSSYALNDYENNHKNTVNFTIEGGAQGEITSHNKNIAETENSSSEHTQLMQPSNSGFIVENGRGVQSRSFQGRDLGFCLDLHGGGDMVDGVSGYTIDADREQDRLLQNGSEITPGIGIGREGINSVPRVNRLPRISPPSPLDLGAYHRELRSAILQNQSFPDGGLSMDFCTLPVQAGARPKNLGKVERPACLRSHLNPKGKLTCLKGAKSQLESTPEDVDLLEKWKAAGAALRQVLVKTGAESSNQISPSPTGNLNESSATDVGCTNPGVEDTDPMNIMLRENEKCSAEYRAREDLLYIEKTPSTPEVSPLISPEENPKSPGTSTGNSCGNIPASIKATSPTNEKPKVSAITSKIRSLKEKYCNTKNKPEVAPKPEISPKPEILPKPEIPPKPLHLVPKLSPEPAKSANKENTSPLVGNSHVRKLPLKLRAGSGKSSKDILQEVRMRLEKDLPKSRRCRTKVRPEKEECEGSSSESDEGAPARRSSPRSRKLRHSTGDEECTSHVNEDKLRQSTGDEECNSHVNEDDIKLDSYCEKSSTEPISIPSIRKESPNGSAKPSVDTGYQSPISLPDLLSDATSGEEISPYLASASSLANGPANGEDQDSLPDLLSDDSLNSERGNLPKITFNMHRTDRSLPDMLPDSDGETYNLEGYSLSPCYCNSDRLPQLVSSSESDDWLLRQGAPPGSPGNGSQVSLPDLEPSSGDEGRDLHDLHDISLVEDVTCGAHSGKKLKYFFFFFYKKYI